MELARGQATAEVARKLGITERLFAATSSHPVRSRCMTGKPARTRRSRPTQAWDGPESPGTLPMPLEFLDTADAEPRVRGAAPAGSATAAPLAVTPVGQIFGCMNQLRRTRQVVSEMVDGYADTVERNVRLMQDAE